MRTHDVRVDLQKVKQLSFIGEVHSFFFQSPASDVTKGILLPVQEQKFGKIMELLSGNDKHVLREGDRIYKIPPCKLDDKTVKRIASRFKAVVVDDVSKATVLLGNELLGRTMERMETPGKDDLFFQHDYLEPGTFDPRYALKETIASGSIFPTLNVFVANVHHEPVYGDLAPSRWMTPLGFVIVHKWITEKIPVMSEDCFLALDEKEKMSAEMLSKIKDLFLQGSEASAKVAKEMLLRSDWTDPGTIVELFLWAQDKELKNVISGFNGRTKREQVFLDKTLLKSLPGMNQGDFLFMMQNIITLPLVSRLEGIEADYHKLDCAFNALGISSCYTLKLVPKEGMGHLLKEI